ncbi:helix-turn-helix domain-containing protein [Comamonas squillarum]|uniref:Helix-turn-helix domain-containing protein n=1 Tax=Comamonas squillarum TaxID=2977320 RepID=A0ABY6A1L6_9BURK|nr:helix-turn-helix domain-containing protein [Comamonas sp. PR12]UXC20021.1 helix-turn-helix domain-containing protein [Comamonas sp. PR12]
MATKPAQGKPVAKKAGGRPSKYKPEYAGQAKKLCMLGMTDKEMASFFGVAESTFNLWKTVHPEFSESLKGGKNLVDAEVAAKLFHRAMGYEHEDVHVSNYQGVITVTPLVKHYPPDTTAAIFWLKNRQPQRWRDKPDEGGEGENAQPVPVKIEVTVKDARKHAEPEHSAGSVPGAAS